MTKILRKIGEWMIRHDGLMLACLIAMNLAISGVNLFIFIIRESPECWINFVMCVCNTTATIFIAIAEVGIFSLRELWDRWVVKYF